jgi:SAM-dependent methyltransferase
MTLHPPAETCRHCGAPLATAPGPCPRCGAEPRGEPERARKAYFDGLYREQPEPWTYSGRAAELLRHEHVARTARRLRPRFERILDVGCSLGQLTARMAGSAPEVYGIDISPTAVRQAQARCDAVPGTRTAFRFAVGSSTEIPFADGAFDLALLCDGLHSWRLSPEDQARTLLETSRLLAPGGHVILTDHLKTRQFDPFLRRVEESPLEVLDVRYLHNRLWYSLARALRPVQDRPPARALLASRWLARGLSGVSRLAGRRGAKHVRVVARKPPAPGAAD